MSTTRKGLRIAFALPRLLPGRGGVVVGGSVNNAIALANSMRKSGIRVDIYAPVPFDLYNNIKAEMAASLTFPIIYGQAPTLGVWEGLRSIYRLLKSLRETGNEYDVIHSHSGTFPYAMVPILLKNARVRIHSLYCPVGTSGGVYSRWWDKAWTARIILRKLDSAVAISDNIRNSLSNAGIQKNQIVTVPMCVDNTRYYPKKRPSETSYFSRKGTRTRLLFVGNASKEKGFIRLLDALAILRARGLQIDVVAALENANQVAGIENERENIERKLRTLDLTDCVRLYGVVKDITSLYAESDIVVLPWISTRGPSDIPMVALEALAMQRCVVASPMPGCQQLFDRGCGGILAEGYDPLSIAKALETAISSDARRLAVAQAGLKVVRKYSADAVSERMLNVYEDILRRKRGRT